MNRQALRPVEFRLDFRNEAFLSRLERIPVLSGHPQWAGDGRVRCIRSVETLKGTSVGGGGKTIYSEFSQIWWLTHWYLEPISRKIFHRNSNWMDISLCSHPNCREVIAMKFCTWHDNCAVQNFVAILCPAMESHWNKFSIEFELRWKNRSRNGLLDKKDEQIWQTTFSDISLKNIALWY